MGGWSGGGVLSESRRQAFWKGWRVRVGYGGVGWGGVGYGRGLVCVVVFGVAVA